MTLHKRIITINKFYFLNCFGTPKDIICMGTSRTLHPRLILHVPGAISVHGGFSTGESRTRARQFGAENSTDWATAAPTCKKKKIFSMVHSMRQKLLKPQAFL